MDLATPENMESVMITIFQYSHSHITAAQMYDRPLQPARSQPRF